MNAPERTAFASPRGRLPARAVRLVGLLASAPLAWACATASARGIVRDQDGRPVAGATVALSPERAPDDNVTGKSGKDGCFGVLTMTRGREAVFLLTVRAPGFKPLSATFPRQKRITADVTLVPDGQTGDSSLARLTSPRELRRFEDVCVPVYPPEATSFGLP